MKCLFYIITGTVIGAYLSQNYIIPDIKKLLNQGMDVAKILEKKMRKNKDEDE